MFCKKITFMFLGLLALVIVACSSTSTTPGEGPKTISPGNEIGGYVELMDALRAAGAMVEPAGEVEQPFFSVKGQVIQVNGVDVQVFEYPDETARSAESKGISQDGSAIGTSLPFWVDQPNFWAKGRVIVLYLGKDAAFLDLLSGALGEPLTSHEVASGGGDLTQFYGEPPAAILEVDGLQQVSGVGSYCWPQEEVAEGASVNLCADAIGIITPQESVAVDSPFIARFLLPIPIPPQELSLSTFPVMEEDRSADNSWQPQVGEPLALPLEIQPEVELDLAPGLHVLNVFARWEGLGDVSYGFLINVDSSESPGSEAYPYPPPEPGALPGPYPYPAPELDVSPEPYPYP